MLYSKWQGSPEEKEAHTDNPRSTQLISISELCPLRLSTTPSYHNKLLVTHNHCSYDFSQNNSKVSVATLRTTFVTKSITFAVQYFFNPEQAKITSCANAQSKHITISSLWDIFRSEKYDSKNIWLYLMRRSNSKWCFHLANLIMFLEII